jgi:hypothetical protein
VPDLPGEPADRSADIDADDGAAPVAAVTIERPRNRDPPSIG